MCSSVPTQNYCKDVQSMHALIIDAQRAQRPHLQCKLQQGSPLLHDIIDILTDEIHDSGKLLQLATATSMTDKLSRSTYSL
jgi:hypothetical protein